MRRSERKEGGVSRERASSSSVREIGDEMEESGTERKEKEAEWKAKKKNERVQGTRRKGRRIEELREWVRS